MVTYARDLLLFLVESVTWRRTMKRSRFTNEEIIEILPVQEAGMKTEPPRVCRRLQLLSRMEHHEQNNEQILT